MPPITQLEVFSHGLKSMNVNSSICPYQYSYQILTSLNLSSLFWRTNRFPPPVPVKQLEDGLQEECYKIPLVYLKLLRGYSKKDCSCIEDKWWSTTMFIKKCVQFLSVRFEVFTVVTMKNAVFWSVTPLWLLYEPTFRRNVLPPSGCKESMS
jgi:hypothetical protein